MHKNHVTTTTIRLISLAFLSHVMVSCSVIPAHNPVPNSGPTPLFLSRADNGSVLTADTQTGLPDASGSWASDEGQLNDPTEPDTVETAQDLSPEAEDFAPEEDISPPEEDFEEPEPEPADLSCRDFYYCYADCWENTECRMECGQVYPEQDALFWSFIACRFQECGLPDMGDLDDPEWMACLFSSSGENDVCYEKKMDCGFVGESGCGAIKACVDNCGPGSDQNEPGDCEINCLMEGNQNAQNLAGDLYTCLESCTGDCDNQCFPELNACMNDTP